MTDSRDAIAILPLQLRREIEGEMEKILGEAAKSMKADHAFICFIQEEYRESEVNLFQFSNGLWVGKESMTLHVLNIHKGLSGRAVSSKKVVIYPLDPEALEHYVKTDERVCSEIAGPIRYRGDVTGVIVLDRVRQEDTPSPLFDDHDRKELSSYIARLEALIQEVEPATDDTRTAAALERDASTIVSAIAKARRGFIAIKGPYGRIRYYKAGDNIKGFRHLSLEEGLAGKVFQTGHRINCGDVLGDPDYIVSDPKIHSELIEPIKLEGETVGIINLESDEPNAFAETDVYVLEGWAKKVADRVRLYRTSAGGNFIYAPGDLAAKIAQVRSRSPDEEVEIGILRALADTVESTFKPRRHGFSRAPATSGELPDCVVRERERKEVLQEAVVYSQGQQRFLIAPVFADEGFLLDLLWLEIESDTDQNDLRGKIDQLCLAASTALKDWKREYRFKQDLSLTRRLVARPTGIDVLQQVVRTVPAIVESDFCTLFHRVTFRGSPFFVPTVSSAPTRLVTGRPEDHPWYEPCIEDGLTACVMVTGQPLVIQDVDNREELQGISRKLGIKATLQWQRHMSEERSTNCRSFMCYPILHPERNGEVIGVIRTHRSQENRRSRFTSEDEDCMQAISSLIAPILVNFCDR